MNQSTQTEVRAKILEKALSLTTSDRNKTYGPPIENLTRMAEMCSAYFGMQFSAHDAAIIMVFAKLSRIPASLTHEDNYVDGAAYFAIAGEMAALGATPAAVQSEQSTVVELGRTGKSIAQGASSVGGANSNSPLVPTANNSGPTPGNFTKPNYPGELKKGN